MADHNYHRRLTALLWDRRVQHPEVPMRPRPDEHAPPLLDHEFEPYRLGSLLICIHLDGTRPCGRGEDEHTPASTSSETEV